MVDLVEIGMKVDSSDFVKAAVNTKDFEVAVAKMVQTVIRETKIMDNVVKASTEARAEAEARVVQNIIIEHQKLTAAKQKEAERQQALAEKQIKEEQSAWFAAQRRRLSLMQESQRIEEKRISDEIKASQSALKQHQKEEAEIKAKAEAVKALAEAETAAYVKTTLAAEKAAEAKAAAFQKGIGGTLGLGSTNASAKGAGTGQAFIEQGLKEEAAERDRVAQATKREADQLEYLKMKYDGSYAAAKLFKSVQDEINLAMSRGVGNADQLKSELDKLQAEYAAFGAGTTDVTNRFNRQAAAVEQSRQGVNKWGLLVQQSGYQAGDFLVQIQSGTNAFVAFGQQATQLVGILPMFAAELGISAVALGGITLGLSIAIPLITAIGAYFMRTSEDAKKAKEQLSDLDSAIKGIDNTLKSWTQTKQAAAQGMTVEQMFGGQSLEQAKTDLGVALRLAEQIQEETRNTTGLDAALLNSIESIWGGGIINRLNAATAEVEKAKQRIIDINAKLVEEQKQNSDDARVALQNEFDMQMSIAKFGEDSAQTKALANKQALDDYNRQVDAQVKANELTEEQGSKLKAANLLNTYLLDITQKLVAAEEKKEQVLIRSYQYMGETMRLSAEQVASYEKENEAINNRLVMEMAIAKFGKDSAEVKKLQREEELDLYDQAIDAQVILGKYTKDQGQALKDSNRIRQDAVDLQQKETDALNRGKALVREFLSTYLDIGKAVDDISKVDLKSVFEDAIAPSSALYQFVSKTWTTMVNMSKFQPRDYSGFTYGGAFAESRMEGPSEPPKIKDKTDIGGVGGGAKTDPLAELQKQIALQEELNGKTEAEQRVRQALGDSWATYSPTVIKGLEEQIQKQIELEDRLKEQQQIFDTVKTSMEDAFMGMVDGTKSAKDAFKSMAAAIIKELYNVLVVQQLVGSFDRATGTGSGLVGMIGSALFRADGGPVSAGQPYIVGERGPEMIIPKSSGMVLTNGQTKAALGGTSNESYVVHNNISVTGSDSVMVRQEIAKMIPQISSATKAAMIDAKRRGGQMGNAFR